MKRATPPIALVVALALAGSMAQFARAQTNETWGGQGSASSWQAGSVKSPSSSPARVANGAESSWSAGKGTVEAHGSPGGVWSDGATLYTAPVQAPGAKSAAGVSSVVKPVGLTKLGTVLSQSRVATASGKGQAAGRPSGSHAPTGAKSLFGPRPGQGKTAGPSRRVSGGRTGANARRGQLGTSSRSGSSSGGLGASGQGLSSSMLSDPAMKGSAVGTSNSMPSLEPHSSLESSPH